MDVPDGVLANQLPELLTGLKQDVCKAPGLQKRGGCLVSLCWSRDLASTAMATGNVLIGENFTAVACMEEGVLCTVLAMFWALNLGSFPVASLAMALKSSSSSTSNFENAHTVLDSACAISRNSKEISTALSTLFPAAHLSHYAGSTAYVFHIACATGASCSHTKPLCSTIC